MLDLRDKKGRVYEDEYIKNRYCAKREARRHTFTCYGLDLENFV